MRHRTIKGVVAAISVLASATLACSDATAPLAGETVGTTTSAVGIAVPSGIGLDPGKLYITFDDGPSGAITPGILDTLKNHKMKNGEPVKATFFITGANIAGHEAIIKRELLEGHMIANHQWEHVQASTAQLRAWAPKEKALLDKILVDVALENPAPYFRYPFGSGTLAKEEVLHSDGYPLGGIGWNLDSLDWCFGGKYNATTRPNGACARPEAASKTDFMAHVKASVSARHGRGVILFHDIQKITAFHLPELLGWFDAQGYTYGDPFPRSAQ